MSKQVTRTHYQRWLGTQRNGQIKAYAEQKNITAGEARSIMWANYKATHAIKTVKTGPRPRLAAPARARSRSRSVGPRLPVSVRARSRSVSRSRDFGRPTKYGRDPKTGRPLTRLGNVRKPRK